MKDNIEKLIKIFYRTALSNATSKGTVDYRPKEQHFRGSGWKGSMTSHYLTYSWLRSGAEKEGSIVEVVSVTTDVMAKNIAKIANEMLSTMSSEGIIEYLKKLQGEAESKVSEIKDIKNHIEIQRARVKRLLKERRYDMLSKEREELHDYETRYVEEKRKLGI